MLELETIEIIKLSDPQQIQDIFYLRNEVFHKEKGYPKEDLCIEEDTEATHFILQINDQPVGCVSVYIDYSHNPLPLEQYFSIGKHKNKMNAEVYKMAILPEYRYKGLWLYLAGNAYMFLKNQNVHNVFITVQVDQEDLLKFYTSLGFKTLNSNFHPLRGEITLMQADLYSKNLRVITKKYEKHIFKKSQMLIKDRSIMEI